MTTTEAEVVATAVAVAEYVIPDGITVASVYPETNEAEGKEYPFFVKSLVRGERESWINTWRTATVSNGYWVSSGRRVHGAAVNAKPTNGMHYLVFGKYIVRYNNEHDITRRNHTTSPWSVVAAADGSPWFFDKDFVADPSSIGDYIPVTWSVSNLGQEVTEDGEPVGPATHDNAVVGITRGMGREEEDGTVLLNPNPEIGEMYLGWTDDAENPRVGVFWGGGDPNEAFLWSGYFTANQWGNDGVEFNSHFRWTTPVTNWVKLRMVASEPVEDRPTDRLERKLATAKAELSEFNQRTNKIAIQHSWCSTYESIVQAVGMKSRWFGHWCATVRVHFEGKFEGVSEYQGRYIGSELGLSDMSIESLHIKGSVELRVTGLQNDDEEQVAGMVTEELVREKLTSSHEGMNLDQMTSFEVVNVYENRDVRLSDFE